ncbi:F-type H+-transporting ATPase subunit F [Candida albicans L26]|uniref:ATP synthase subunit f, mitochondrial n=1 Tax=Candida albicans TaxID=5476 RepID=A0A8H6C5G3_CANAX|nr:ATP synthase subunit f, mitochondrial [Candida albicans]KGQ82642.1 F-type H+-transporting ATPase subunit F [Candida albicans P37005]KGU03116.1 F-type H+-transporting ATPase subunit F [Candida albicans L26]KGU03385.1 F-type H+-transporting ATPase subunit F [Candida albicans 19F]
MSFVIRRQLSTLIPPKIASAKNLGSNPNAKRMAEVVKFYNKLPQGPAPAAKKSNNPFARYRAAYFDSDNASGKPLVHLAIAVVIFGYSLEYQHLKHAQHEGH